MLTLELGYPFYNVMYILRRQTIHCPATSSLRDGNGNYIGEALKILDSDFVFDGNFEVVR